MSLDDKTVERFWSKVKILGNDECWNWQACKNPLGYGRISIGKKTLLSHRVAWMIANDREPSFYILHSCNNPACCNPRHLREGSQQENMDDKVRSNRQARGEKNGRNALKEEQVLAIYNSGISLREAATKYGISQRAIEHIRSGSSWSWLTGASKKGEKG